MGPNPTPRRRSSHQALNSLLDCCQRNLASSKRVTQHGTLSSPLLYLTSWRSTVLFAADGWLVKRPATSKLALHEGFQGSEGCYNDRYMLYFVHPPGCTTPGVNPNVSYKLRMIIMYHCSSYMRECLLSSFSRVCLLATLRTVTH